MRPPCTARPRSGSTGPANVVVLEDSEPVEVVPGVELVAAPWFNKHPLADLVAGACEGLEPTGAVRIVAGHGALDMFSPDPSHPALISVTGLEEHLSAETIHYVALGDRHSTTEVGQSERIWYAGAPEPTDYIETDPGNVVVVGLDASEVQVRVEPVGVWRFVRRDWRLTGDRDIDHFAEWLRDLEDKERTILKLALVGTVSLAQKARLDSLLDHHTDLFAAAGDLGAPQRPGFDPRRRRRRRPRTEGFRRRGPGRSPRAGRRRRRRRGRRARRAGPAAPLWCGTGDEGRCRG